MSWDPIAASRLAEMKNRAVNAGFVEAARPAVRELWRANLDRYEPKELFDDARTLGFSASINVTNRLFAELGPQGPRRSPEMFATWELQTVVLHVGDVAIRSVKTPGSRGRKPRFATDFNWEEREGRASAAARNAAQVDLPVRIEGASPLFEVEVPDARAKLAACRDAFFVWGGDSDGRTAGWIGIPTVGRASWLAVDDLWFDDDLLESAIPDRPTPGGDRTFTELASPEPEIRLKRSSGEASG